jgi:asparagine synthase (glutamine-hydrolysing)
MKRAVERRLRADVPVVSYLSGGVDSSVVVALSCAQRRLDRKGPIPTYTISVQAPSLDERAEATEVAQHLGASQVVVDFRRQDVLNAYPELIRAAEAPVIDTSCAALMLLARAVHRDGYKVALTGEGADEWLAGYSWYKISPPARLPGRHPGTRTQSIRPPCLSATDRRAEVSLGCSAQGGSSGRRP